MYRLWARYIDGSGGFWSKAYDGRYADRASAQTICDQANVRYPSRGINYEVAKDNGDNGPSFFDVNDLEEDLEPVTDSEVPFDIDEPIPYTLRSSQIEVPSSKAPDAKRFVNIEDLRASANKVTEQTHQWKIGKAEISKEPIVNVTSMYGRTFIDGRMITPEEVSALIVALSDALKATEAA